MDCQFNAAADGRRLTFLNVIYEYSRLCLTIRVDRRCTAWDVVYLLEELTVLHPAPAFIRSDNGHDFSAHALRRWCTSSGTSTAFSQPGSPLQNGSAESFDSRFRDEFLNTELFTTVAEAQGLSNRWRWVAPFVPPGAYAPGGSSSNSGFMNTHFHCTWTNQEGHIKELPEARQFTSHMDLHASNI